MADFYLGSLIHPALVAHAEWLLDASIGQKYEIVTSPEGVEATAYICCNFGHFVGRMTEFMIESGLAKPEEFSKVDQNDPKDFRSRACLSEVYDVNHRHDQGKRSYWQGMESESVVYLWPAWKFVRRYPSDEPPDEWKGFEGMVVMKNDRDFWSAFEDDPLIGLREPWNPYGFSAYFDLRDVPREEAAKLGLPVDSVRKPPLDPESKAAKLLAENPGMRERLLAEIDGKLAELKKAEKSTEDYVAERIAQMRARDQQQPPFPRPPVRPPALSTAFSKKQIPSSTPLCRWHPISSATPRIRHPASQANRR